MFKNPIKKYQNGGSVNQNQAMQQVVEFISQVAKVSPEEVMATLDKIKGDEDAINALSQALELAKNNDERGFQTIQLMFNPKTNTQFAKDGGKLHDFICKHAKGGYVAGCGCKEDGGTVNNKGYTVQVNAPGDTTRTKQYNYRQEIMQTYPDGSVRYTTRTTGGEPTEIHTWGPEGIPNIWRRLWFGNKQANPETVNNWRDIIANHPEDPRNVLNRENGGIVKGQKGLNIPAEPPTGYNGEIRQYIDRRNPIRRRIDIFVENNPYARKIVSLGKGIKESPLGILLPDFSNGIAGSVAPAGKISKTSNLDKKSKAAMDRILSEYREDPFKAGMPDNFTGTYSYSTERPFGLSDDPFGFYNNGGIIKGQDGSVINYYKNKLNNDFFV